MNFADRRAGLLLHPTSLPSGTLADVGRWLDFLHAAGFGVWQVLPLGIPLTGLSPYQCASAFAINPELFPASSADLPGFAEWRARQRHWLEDFARFMVIKAEQGGAPWTAWPVALRDREAQALAAFDAAHASELQAVMRAQHAAAVHWQEIHAAATSRAIALFGDMPLFVAHDSADVWAHRHLFLLDAAGEPTMVAGVPPDYFSKTGQRWGNPHYDWNAMQTEGFAWWRQRLAAHFEWFDLVRIDHFRGLVAAWQIPAGEPTAVEGSWVDVPGAALLQKVAEEMGELPLVAEDLGIITPEVTALRQHFGLPGMAVLQFAFDAHADNPHKPENVHSDTVYYTGTHDNDTTPGWWHALPEDARGEVMQQLGVDDAEAVPERMIDTVLHSQAALTVFPLQDLLGLGSEARMNTPGTNHGNWKWRFHWDALPPDLATHTKKRLQDAHRCEKPPIP
ncbi:MAG TPA: 4-alpha-glucanotransferase [Thiobacillaceae bacterium]|nr:4-alpha-glucanotransferase [Thiobacillaceae bacterium]